MFKNGQKQFKKGQKVVIVKYIADKSRIGQTGTILKDSIEGNFDEVRMDKDGSTMLFWYKEIEVLLEA